jgi:hypothetical protein
MNAYHAARHTEIRELLLENFRVHQERIAIVRALVLGRRREECRIGQFEGAARSTIIEVEGFLFGFPRASTLFVMIDDVGFFAATLLARRRLPRDLPLLLELGLREFGLGLAQFFFE